MKLKLILAAVSLLLTSSAAIAQDISEADYNNLLKEVNSPQTKREVENFLYNLKNYKIRGQSEINALWNFYRASGSDQIVRKVINLLDSSQSITGNPKIDNFVRTQARSSLQQYANQYKEVRQIVIESYKSLPNGQLKQTLGRIISQFSR